MAENSQNATVKSALQGTIEQPAGPLGDDHETHKETLLSFSSSGVFLSLKLVSKWDDRNGVRREPVPRLTCSIGGEFVELPLSARFWADFSDFVSKLARSLEGTDLANLRVEDDVDFAKEKLRKYKAD